ncbi:hypothetical protein EPO04_04185 [Patescibacteria group bacterium]|nr:MAG: hypothetical protein EPO04_04185 [Patescibacteria group bacterium]
MFCAVWPTELPDNTTIRLADSVLFFEQQHLPRPRLHFVLCPEGTPEGVVTQLAAGMTLYSLDEDQGLRQQRKASAEQIEFNRQNQEDQAHLEAAREVGRQEDAAFERQLLSVVKDDVERYTPNKSEQCRLAAELIKDRERLDPATAAAVCSILGVDFEELVVHVVGSYAHLV